MSVDTDKKELRKIIQQKKKLLSKEDKDREALLVFEQLEKLIAFHKAEHILSYWSLPDELETQHFVEKWHSRKNIYLPRVVGDHVEVVPYKGYGMMQKGAFNILEPSGQAIADLKQIDFVIVPGVAFTTNGCRMGRGGGYYDRLLPLLEQAVKIGVCYQCQIVEDLPIEKHDVKMDTVLFA